MFVHRHAGPDASCLGLCTVHLMFPAALQAPGCTDLKSLSPPEYPAGNRPTIVKALGFCALVSGYFQLLLHPRPPCAGVGSCLPGRAAQVARPTFSHFQCAQPLKVLPPHPGTVLFQVKSSHLCECWKLPGPGTPASPPSCCAYLMGRLQALAPAGLSGALPRPIGWPEWRLPKAYRLA